MYKLIAMGSVLLLKRMENQCDVEAKLVNPRSGSSLEVYSPIAKRATESGKMRRLDRRKCGYILGYRDLGFKDDSWEYWVMIQ